MDDRAKVQQLSEAGQIIDAVMQILKKEGCTGCAYALKDALAKVDDVAQRCWSAWEEETEK